MIRAFSIKNFKSILDHTIELGRLNVFIGENGSGKTNILEAMAMASAALSNKLDAEELYSKGIRIAKPSITFSSFLGVKQGKAIHLVCRFQQDQEPGVPLEARFEIVSRGPNLIDFEWFSKAPPSHDGTVTVREMNRREDRLAALKDFAVYNLNTLALRGVQAASRKTPLGINGENLDVLLSTFDKKTFGELIAGAKIVSWVDKILIDVEDALKFSGHKMGRGTSILYFRDKFMGRGNNIFSAENANEGILHILFYLALFMSRRTPKIFGIDNIETALNPQLCRDLIKELATLVAKNDKQALITTHNPAILDGLDLHDDEQRLFVVSRNDEGHTVTRRIKLKPQPEGEKYKLSELWMRGHLGGLPRQF